MNVIDKENIRLKVAVENWKEAVREAGNLLVDSGRVTEGYIGRMIESVEKLGPYIVIIPRVALPHARPDGTVLTGGSSLITLKTPVEFGNADNDPVDVVIAFAARSDTGHLESIAGISRFLEDEERLEALRKTLDIETAFQLINQTSVD